MEKLMNNILIMYLMMLFQMQKSYSIKCDRKTIMNGKYLRIWKEVVTYLKVLSQKSSGETEEN
jgi:hypothetical protein